MNMLLVKAAGMMTTKNVINAVSELNDNHCFFFPQFYDATIDLNSGS